MKITVEDAHTILTLEPLVNTAGGNIAVVDIDDMVTWFRQVLLGIGYHPTSVDRALGDTQDGVFAYGTPPF